MLVFSTSDKGGTGRTVTSCNIAYRLSTAGRNVAYLDFDFGSPTAGALFEISGLDKGTSGGRGLHQYLLGENTSPAKHDVRKETSRVELRAPRSPYKLILYAGDRGGAEFSASDDAIVRRCAELFVRLEQEFDIIIVDLSAGRSAALEIALRATAAPQLRNSVVRWLIFHRWTRQHILAANDLIHGPHGLLEAAKEWGHDAQRLLGSIRYVRTAVPLASDASIRTREAQSEWLQTQNETLRRLAIRNELGDGVVLGSTPIEPVLQWREQIILDSDVSMEIANEGTVLSFTKIATDLVEDAVWENE
ncbi:SCO2523 family variant P-loop protein [Nocardia sp. NPDC003482]